MADREEIERLRVLVMDLGLPRNEFAMFGVKCPYCGKSDRIHRLEPPAELEDAPAAYVAAWQDLEAGAQLVLCKFCRQLLSFSENDNNVAPLV